MAIDQDKLTEFLHKFVADLGATMAAGNVLVGLVAAAGRSQVHARVVHGLGTVEGEDLPAELSDPELTGRRFMRVKVWEANWTEPMAQGIDFHEFYLHRGVNIWRLFNYRLGFFRPKVAYTGGVKITSEDETSVNAAWAGGRSLLIL